MPDTDLLISGYAFLECPRWHDGALWVSDFYTYQVLRVDGSGTARKVLDVPEQPSGLGWLPDGDMLVVSMRDRKILRWDGTAVKVHADLWGLAESHLNDMVVDAHGRAYVGNFGSDAFAGEALRDATLFRIDPDGAVHPVARELRCPNGMTITPDGNRMYLSESTGNRVSTFDISDGGDLGERRDWCALGAVPTGSHFETAAANGELVWVPDGMSLDAEGAIWVADAIGGRAVRIRDGVIEDAVSTADRGLTVVACALGGPDGRTLHLCAAEGFEEHACKARHSSCVLTTRVDVPHAGLP
jgi:sugar lactone lactonase YvrE